MKKNRRWTSLLNLLAVTAIYFLLRAVLQMQGGNRAVESLLVQIYYSIIMAASLNLVTGVLGELTLGHAGFMAVGGYTAAIFTTKVFPQHIAFFPAALILGGFMAALFGYLVGIPALRLRGDYLAIITLGFGEIIRVLINTVFAPWTGGGKKMFNIPLYTNADNAYWIMVVVVAMIYMIAFSRHGRAILSIRENEVASESSGVPVTRYKTQTFVLSAFFAGIAGGLYAHSIGVLDPSKFDFNASINYLVMVVFGGMGSITGSIVSAGVLTVVQFLMAKLVEFRQLAYALLLIVMMIFKPGGLLGIREFSLNAMLARLFPRLYTPARSGRMERLLTLRKTEPLEPGQPDYASGQNGGSVLSLQNLGIRFGGLQAAEDVDIELKNNEIVGLIGPNGAGKTTIFNMLTGVYRPSQGKIHLLGKPLNGQQTYQITHSGMARTFQNIRLFKSMTVLENVEVGFQGRMRYSWADAFLRNSRYDREERGCEARARELLRVFSMEHLMDQKANSLPYGQQRKLEICRALASNPKVLLLDEPAAGMNPIETQELMQTIQTIRDRFGITILLIEHDMKLVMGICERIYVLNYGRIIASGSPGEIRSNPDVIAAYLGVTEEEGATC